MAERPTVGLILTNRPSVCRLNLWRREPNADERERGAGHGRTWLSTATPTLRNAAVKKSRTDWPTTGLFSGPGNGQDPHGKLMPHDR